MPVKTTKTESNNFLVQGAILAIAGILVRFIGLAYRVPLLRVIGADGMGYYSIAYNVYAIILLLSSYSLPLAVSKMVSVRILKNEYKNANKILKAALIYATIVGGLGSIVAFFGADFFCKHSISNAACKICTSKSGTDDMDYGISWSASRIFSRTFNHGSHRSFTDI